MWVSVRCGECEVWVSVRCGECEVWVSVRCEGLVLSLCNRWRLILSHPLCRTLTEC